FTLFGLTLSPDGKTVAVAGPENLVCLWDVATGKQIAFLQDHLRLTPPPDLKEVVGLLADLDSDDLAVREKAVEQLEKLGEAAQPALQKALEGPPSIEEKRRIEHLLDKLREAPERLQPFRARSVERLETAESRRLLEKLAAGPADAYLTKE